MVTDHSTPTPGHEPYDLRLSRGRLLRGAAGAMLASPLIAAACGGSSSGTSAASTTAAGGPKRGGTLRVGFVSGGTAETVNPLIGVTPIDQGRIQVLFDPLVMVTPDLQRKPGLALEFNANADATEYEVKLRPDVVFHNGKTLGAEDVVYSIQQMAGKTSYALPFVSNIDLNGLKAAGKLAVRIPLKTPDADLAANFIYYNTWIFPAGITAEQLNKQPIGTGPFKFESFTPGQQSVLARNPHYWESGKPYVDSLKYIAITDNNARLNALLSGQIDAMAQLPTAQAKAHAATGDMTVLSAHSPQAMMFYMDTTKPPFSDVNVRQAIKLIADRPALIEGALNGYGSVGNDIFGKGLPFYDTSLPQRTADPEQAKSLLQKAGQANLTVVLQTSQIFPGFVEAATLLSEQAKAAGVTMNLKQVAADSYYNPSLLYLKMPFAETQWPISSLKFFYLQALASDAPYNETHWSNAAWSDTLTKAIGELDQTKAQDLWNQVQQTQYDEGGYINWTNADWVDGLSNKVKGLQPSGAGALGNFRFQDAWLE